MRRRNTFWFIGKLLFHFWLTLLLFYYTGAKRGEKIFFDFKFEF